MLPVVVESMVMFSVSLPAAPVIWSPPVKVVEVPVLTETKPLTVSSAAVPATVSRPVVSVRIVLQ